MAIFLNEILTALKQELEDSAFLSDIDTVVIRKYRRTNLPDFDEWCIIVSPVAAHPQPYPAGGQRRIRYEIDLVVLGKITTTESQATEDIVEIYENVFLALYKNDLNGTIELYPGLTELDGKALFSVIADEDRGDFIMEAVIPYSPSGERFINPE